MPIKGSVVLQLLEDAKKNDIKAVQEAIEKHSDILISLLPDGSFIFQTLIKEANISKEMLKLTFPGVTQEVSSGPIPVCYMVNQAPIPLYIWCLLYSRKSHQFIRVTCPNAQTLIERANLVLPQTTIAMANYIINCCKIEELSHENQSWLTALIIIFKINQQTLTILMDLLKKQFIVDINGKKTFDFSIFWKSFRKTEKLAEAFSAISKHYRQLCLEANTKLFDLARIMQAEPFDEAKFDSGLASISPIPKEITPFAIKALPADTLCAVEKLRCASDPACDIQCVDLILMAIAKNNAHAFQALFAQTQMLSERHTDTAIEKNNPNIVLPCLLYEPDRLTQDQAKKIMANVTLFDTIIAYDNEMDPNYALLLLVIHRYANALHKTDLAKQILARLFGALNTIGFDVYRHFTYYKSKKLIHTALYYLNFNAFSEFVLQFYADKDPDALNDKIINPSFSPKVMPDDQEKSDEIKAGFTILHLCVVRNRLQELLFLLQSTKVDTGATSYTGKTAAHLLLEGNTCNIKHIARKIITYFKASAEDRNGTTIEQLLRPNGKSVNFLGLNGAGKPTRKIEICNCLKPLARGKILPRAYFLLAELYKKENGKKLNFHVLYSPLDLFYFLQTIRINTAENIIFRHNGQSCNILLIRRENALNIICFAPDINIPPTNHPLIESIWTAACDFQEAVNIETTVYCNKIPFFDVPYQTDLACFFVCTQLANMDLNHFQLDTLQNITGSDVENIKFYDYPPAEVGLCSKDIDFLRAAYPNHPLIFNAYDEPHHQAKIGLPAPINNVIDQFRRHLLRGLSQDDRLELTFEEDILAFRRLQDKQNTPLEPEDIYIQEDDVVIQGSAHQVLHLAITSISPLADQCNTGRVEMPCDSVDSFLSKLIERYKTYSFIRIPESPANTYAALIKLRKSILHLLDTRALTRSSTTGFFEQSPAEPNSKTVSIENEAISDETPAAAQSNSH